MKLNKPNPLVSIVILNYNGKGYTKALLDSIKKIDFPKNKIETIIVDNGSTDGSQEFIKKNYPYVKQIENKQNLGFDEGTNSGVRHAKGKYVAMLSNDIIVDKNWLKELVNAIESDKRIGIVEPRLFNKTPNGNYEIDEYGTTSLFQTLAFRSDIKKRPKNPIKVFTPTSACLYRRELVDLPFDKDYFAYAEDTYFGWKIRLMGYEIIQVQNSVLYHEGSATIKKINRNRYFEFLAERNKLLNILTFYEGKTLTKLIPLLALFTILVNLYDMKSIKIRIKAYLWILSNLQSVTQKRKKIQSLRKIPDKEITPLMSSKFIDEKNVKRGINKILIKILNKYSSLYCRIAGIKTMS